MWILIVALLALTALAMIIGKGYYYRINKKIEKGELEEIPPVVEVDEECCGQHETCEKDSLLLLSAKVSSITTMKNWTASVDVHRMNIQRKKWKNSAK